MHGTFEPRGGRKLDDKSPLAILFGRGQISEAEYLAGDKWRKVYLAYLASIGAPEPYGSDIEEFSDARCQQLADDVKFGNDTLMSVGRRAMHAVNSVVIYEEPEELGDYEQTARAAQKGLAALVLVF